MAGSSSKQMYKFLSIPRVMPLGSRFASTDASGPSLSTSSSTATTTATAKTRDQDDLSPVPAAFRASSTPSTNPPQDRSTPVSSARDIDIAFQRRTSFGNLPRARYVLHTFASRNNTILTLSLAPLPDTPASSSSQTRILKSAFDQTSNSTTSNESELLERPVLRVSTGMAGFKGANRGSFDAAVEVAIRMFKAIHELAKPSTGTAAQGTRSDTGARSTLSAKLAKKKRQAKLPPPTEIEMVWNGFGQGREAIFRTLMSSEGDNVRQYVTRVTDKTPFKVGGTRPRKARMV